MRLFQACRAVLALVIAAILPAAQAEASVMYASFTGVIEYSSNPLGLFGASDSLVGQTVRIQLTYDLIGGRYYQISDRSGAFGGSNTDSPTTMTAIATVNGRSEGFEGSFFSEAYYDFRDVLPLAKFSLEDQWCCAATRRGVNISVLDPSLGLPHPLAQSYSFEPTADSGGVIEVSRQVGDEAVGSFIYFHVTHVAISSVAPVPLPGAGSLALGGFGAVMVLRRRGGKGRARA